MLNSNTLDTVIAMVIVLLILSLVVQSAQQGLKKLFKIKSRQIEDSLVDLFEHILDEKPNVPAEWWKRMVQNSPFLRIFGGKHPSEHNEKVEKLYCEVTEKFQQAGRVTQTGKLMLDSIAKQDLVKVLGTVAPSVLTPDFQSRLDTALGKFEELAATIKGFDPSKFSQNLSDSAKEKLAQMQGALRPLINDINAYLSGDSASGTSSPPGDKKVITSVTLLQDIMKLRTIRLEDISHLVSEAEKAVEEQLARANQDPKGGLAVIALTEGGDTLRVIARGVADFDRTVSQLLASLTKAEQWFDTVMQSFEERYARGMKTWGVIISLVVVILLNANFFDVYKNIAGNDTLRANIVQMRDDLAKRYEESAVRGDQPAAADTLKKLYQDTAKNVGDSASLFTGLGFTPIWESPPKGFFHSLIGWMIMTLLLSVGAPFWQDTLESLFGLKNVLRKQSDTKNVENKGGQPKP